MEITVEINIETNIGANIGTNYLREGISQSCSRYRAALLLLHLSRETSRTLTFTKSYVYSVAIVERAEVIPVVVRIRTCVMGEGVAGVIGREERGENLAACLVAGRNGGVIR